MINTSPASKVRLIGTLALAIPLWTPGLCADAHEGDQNLEIVRIMTDAARCIYYPHFDAPEPREMFNDSEIEFLARHSHRVNLMIRDALDRGDSICGAHFSKQFGLAQNLDLLRARIIKPGRFYGWEGSYDPADDPHLSDNQYVYHSTYVAVAESLAGKAIHQIIILDDGEKSELLSIARDPDRASHEWALWLLKKLHVPLTARTQ